MPTALITGAGGGLGKALISQFDQSGWDLILNHRSRQTDKSGRFNPYTIVQGDIRNEGVKYALLSRAQKGGIDALIHNAGEHRRKSLFEISLVDYQDLIVGNLMATIELTRILWFELAKSKGRIIFVNSIAGKAGGYHETLYCAVKHGLAGFARSLQFEACEVGIRVTSVFVGAMQTSMSRGRKDWPKLMDPEEVAGQIYYLCAAQDESLRIPEIDIMRMNY